MTTFKRNFARLGLAVLVLVPFTSALAVAEDPPSNTLINPLGTTDLMTFLGKILTFVTQIGTIAIVVMVVYDGYLFVVARGNETKISEARQALLYTIIGALILLGAQAIADGIKDTVTAL
jgi:TrbC/VIRB2 pilin